LSNGPKLRRQAGGLNRGKPMREILANANMMVRKEF
jgi:hypothetical protein